MNTLLVALAIGAPVPQLLWTDQDAMRITQQSKSDPVLTGLIEWNRRLADRTLQQGVETRPKGRLLPTAWQISYKVLSTATQYRLTGDKRYARRAITEMLAVAQFSDWEPTNFLGTAETLMPLTLGLSWCAPEMTSEELRIVRDAIVAKGLQPGLTAIQSGEEWTRRDNNWAQVTSGALGLGASLVRDSHPKLSREILTWVTQEALPRIDTQFAGDGVPGEGPVYWRYGLNFQALLNDVTPAFEAPGYAHTGDYGMHNVGPTGATFNFGDASPSFHVTPAFFALSRQFEQPNLAAWARTRLGEWLSAKSPFTDEERFTILNIALWPKQIGPFTPPKLDRVFSGRQSVAFLRSSWTSPDATWLGVKGGDNSAAHAQLDLGSFVFEQHGVRWLVDPGKDSYDLPGYFDARREIGTRWQLFRNRNEAHNTLSFGNGIQDAGASASVRLTEHPTSPSVTVDLSKAYRNQARRVVRTVKFEERDRVIIRDLYEGSKTEVTLNFYTNAQVTLQGHVATLSQSGKTILLALPARAQWRLGRTQPSLADEDPNEGLTRLTAAFSKGSGEARVEIRAK